MFCVECGKETKIFKDGVCINCYLKTHRFTEGPKIIDLPICTTCGSFKYKNTWTNALLGDVLRRLVKSNFKISRELEKTDINTNCTETKHGLKCKIYISGFIDDNEITEEHDILVRLKKTVCDVCSKRSGGYHEAIIQIRTEGKELTKKQIQNLQISVGSMVENMQAKGNRALFITDVGEEHGGLDFYISDKGAAQTITKKLHEQYGGEIKQSSKNVGMKDSKQIYRVTYLLRLPSFKQGDFIEFNNSFYMIKSVSPKKICMLNLENLVEEFFDIKKINNVKILGGEELIRDMILVSQNKNEVQVMDLKTYKTIEIRKPENYKINSKTVKILIIDGNYFLLKN